MKTKLMSSWLMSAHLLRQKSRELRRLPSANPEAAGRIANNIIADRLISGLCPSGGVFLDIGAQYGAVFSSAYRNDNSISVMAFEAEPKKAAALKSAYPYCEVFSLAVGESEGQATFYLDPKASGYNSLLKDEKKEQTPITVQMASLDSLLPDSSIDVMKIDIEGAELGALRGGAKLIKQNRPLIMFESVGLGVNALGHSPEMIWEWLSDYGFSIFSPDRVAHTAPGFSLEAFIDAHHYPFRTHNYFAVHFDKINETRERARAILEIRSG